MAPRFLIRVAALAAVASVLGGCTLAGGRPAGAAPPGPPSPGTLSPGWTETGVASWYGEPFHGRRTASGQVYDMEAASAAHPTLPFGTRVRVENLDNGRSVVLVINDRGPFKKERILDVSRRMARELGMLGPGTARVRITVLELPGGFLEGRGSGARPSTARPGA